MKKQNKPKFLRLYKRAFIEGWLSKMAQPSPPDGPLGYAMQSLMPILKKQIQGQIPGLIRTSLQDPSIMKTISDSAKGLLPQLIQTGLKDPNVMKTITDSAKNFAEPLFNQFQKRVAPWAIGMTAVSAGIPSLVGYSTKNYVQQAMKGINDKLSKLEQGTPVNSTQDFKSKLSKIYGGQSFKPKGLISQGLRNAHTGFAGPRMGGYS